MFNYETLKGDSECDICRSRMYAGDDVFVGCDDDDNLWIVCCEECKTIAEAEINGSRSD